MVVLSGDTDSDSLGSKLAYCLHSLLIKYIRFSKIMDYEKGIKPKRINCQVNQLHSEDCDNYKPYFID